MKNHILFLALLTIFSCEKELIKPKDIDSTIKYINDYEINVFNIDSLNRVLKDVAQEQEINTIVLSVDSLTKYTSDYDWFSIATNREYDVETNVFNIDSLGKITKLTSLITTNDYTITYELSELTTTKLTMVGNRGLTFKVKTTNPEQGFLNVKITNAQFVVIYEHKYPMNIAAP